MAIEYKMRAVCDQCKEDIEPWVDVKKANIDDTRWDWQDKWEQSGIMKGLPSRYGKYKLYCAKCAGT